MTKLPALFLMLSVLLLATAIVAVETVYAQSDFNAYLGNAISDGHLVVYYPHLLVHPEHQGQGIGRKMMAVLLKKYSSFHQQMLVADGKAIGFYESLGFKRAGQTEPMWIYAGGEH